METGVYRKPVGRKYRVSPRFEFGGVSVVREDSRRKKKKRILPSE